MEEERTVNIPALRKAVEWVEEQENLDRDDPNREWFQHLWIKNLKAYRESLSSAEDQAFTWQCDTAMCFAGFVVLCIGEGYKPHPLAPAEVINGQGLSVPVEVVSNEILGITVDQGMLLYDGFNDAPTIRHYAELIAGEKL